MSAPEYDIIFRGDIVFGHQLSEVKLKLQQLFKVDASKVDALFTGRPVPLKRKLDEATASKYRDVLIKAGAQVEICPTSLAAPVASAPKRAAATPATAPATPVSPESAASNAPSSPSGAVPGWTIAPVGADLLPPDQRPPAAAPVRVNISSLSLHPQTGNLVEASEVAPVPVTPPPAPDFQVAELGAALADNNSLPLVEVDINLDWEIADVGADLLSEEERPMVVPVAIGPVDFGLAPAGSDLGQLKPKVQPLNPDISRLKLVDTP